MCDKKTRLVGDVPDLAQPWLEVQSLVRQKSKELRKIINSSKPEEALVLLKAQEILDDLGRQFFEIAMFAMTKRI